METRPSSSSTGDNDPEACISENSQVSNCDRLSQCLVSINPLIRHEQVLSLVQAVIAANGAEANLSAPSQQRVTADGSARSRRSSQPGRIPIVDTVPPDAVNMSVRVAGVKVATYLNSSAALARAGLSDGSLRDSVATLTEAFAQEIECCVEIDVVGGKVLLMYGSSATVYTKYSTLRSAVQCCVTTVTL